MRDLHSLLSLYLNNFRDLQTYWKLLSRSKALSTGITELSSKLCFSWDLWCFCHAKFICHFSAPESWTCVFLGFCCCLVFL